jgi:hypothetical protein
MYSLFVCPHDTLGPGLWLWCLDLSAALLLVQVVDDVIVVVVPVVVDVVVLEEFRPGKIERDIYTANKTRLCDGSLT